MSEKAANILCELWNRVDQADYDTMIMDAFRLLPTKVQKEFIERILDNDSWDLNGKPSDEDLEKYRRYVSG